MLRLITSVLHVSTATSVCSDLHRSWPYVECNPILGRLFVPALTAVLAVSQISPVNLPTLSGGPLSFRLLDDGLAHLKATASSISKLQLKQLRNQQRDLHPRQCHGPLADWRFQQEAPMSQAHVASRSPPSPLGKNVQPLPSSRDSRTLPPINNIYNAGGGISLSQSPSTVGVAAGTNSTTSAEARSSRPIGVQNLLNPAGAFTSDGQSRRRHIEQVDQSLQAPGVNRGPLASTVAPAGSITLPNITPPPINAYPSYINQGPRRNLTPISPSGYAGTPPTFNPPTATIDAKRSPFGASRELNNILGPEAAALPEPVNGSHSTFAYPNPAGPQDSRTSVGSISLQTPAERRASLSGASQIHMSQSESPTPSYSPFSQFSRTPPVPLPNNNGNQPTASGYFPHAYTPGAAATYSHGENDSKESYSPRTSSAGQNPYHPMMTLRTDEGPIQVPVDLQAASKVADEKRKRNATASHRFRQRRKEKERETSQNIAKLEHHVRELTEEREFYRLERDFFRSLAKNNNIPVPLGPRPPSPRQLRLAQLGGAGTYANPHWPTTEENSRTGRNTRRRTSSYVPPQGLAPPVNIAAPHPPRHGPITLNAPDNGEAGSRSQLAGALSLKSGLYDSAPPNYDHGWKTGQ